MDIDTFLLVVLPSIAGYVLCGVLAYGGVRAHNNDRPVLAGLFGPIGLFAVCMATWADRGVPFRDGFKWR